MTLIIKRNKKAQNFSEQKLKSSIKRVFKSINQELPEGLLDDVLNGINVADGMTTSEIQNQVEDWLMKYDYFEAARYFIIYRHINYHSKSLVDRNKFFFEYLNSANPATGSKFDANANVTEKNLATFTGELFKGDFIKFNRFRLQSKIRELYGDDLANEYVRQLNTHELYKHDETSIFPYCVAISMYPFLLDGIRPIGGLSAKPKNLDSFCGMFCNLVFAISAQFAGAVATGEFLMYFDYFARKDYGNDYWNRKDNFYNYGPRLMRLQEKSGKLVTTLKDIEDLGGRKTNPKTEVEQLAVELYESHNNGKLGDGSRTIESILEQKFQQVVYTLNQPAAARNFQSTFWNISYFDKSYFEGMFNGFVFPDGTAPMWDSLNWLQKKFMRWFNEERTKCLLTFPVETMALLTDGEDIIDKEYADFTSEMYSKGHSFFTYLSDNPDSLSSCCRLRNEIQDNTFSYTLGAGGVATGSKSVMTLNLNRLIQNAIKEKKNYIEYLRENIHKVHKYQTAFNELLKEYKEMGALPVYDAGFISLDKQYLTLGINGMVEAAEFLGIKPEPSEEYLAFTQSILKTFYDENKAARTKELMFNTEFVPAENLGVKYYNWDKEAGYVVPTTRNCYNSYFYPVEDESLTILDKFELHGNGYVQYLDGGSALHMNMDAHLSKDQYRNVLKIASNLGTNYFTFNIPNTICNDCDHIDKRYLKACPKCGSNNIDYATRVIGYLKRVSNFSMARQKEANNRAYFKADSTDELITPKEND